MASSTNNWRRLTHTDDPPIVRSNALVRRVLEQPDLFAHTLLQISADWRKLLLVISTVSRSWALAAEPALRAPLFGGGQSAPLLREVFVATDAALVLPYDPLRDRVLLVEQFRMGPYGRGDPRPFLLEPVAGRIDAGETPEEAARREGLRHKLLASTESVQSAIHLHRKTIAAHLHPKNSTPKHAGKAKVYAEQAQQGLGSS